MRVATDSGATYKARAWFRGFDGRKRRVERWGSSQAAAQRALTTALEAIALLLHPGIRVGRQRRQLVNDQDVQRIARHRLMKPRLPDHADRTLIDDRQQIPQHLHMREVSPHAAANLDPTGRPKGATPRTSSRASLPSPCSYVIATVR